MNIRLLLLLCCLSDSLIAQIPHEHPHDRAIDFPDIPGYLSLVCDFHQHSVFSDGTVWPSIRVEEALRDSVDAISLTEHLEYQPWEKDMLHPDRNRSYQLAQDYARPYELLIIHGAEITREMPPGHTNAIFIQDANKLLMEDSIAVFREAKRQGAFTFWNHPNWIVQREDGMATLTDLHQWLIKEGLLDGIEVVNNLTYSEEALQIALDHNLTIMGTSDIHGLVDWQYKIPQGGHRPVTLVFSKERTVESIKEGLQNRRTVVWFNNTLIGREEFLVPLIESSLEVVNTGYQGISAVVDVKIFNKSDAQYILVNQSNFTFNVNTDIVVLPPNTTTKISVKTLQQLDHFELKFKVLNAVLAPKQHPDIIIPVKVKL